MRSLSCEVYLEKAEGGGGEVVVLCVFVCVCVEGGGGRGARAREGGWRRLPSASKKQPDTVPFRHSSAVLLFFSVFIM